ncbi:MAG: hypothetical protein WC417_04280 [Candidatus Omnitrophota bacterium]|jgi:hypothetical protein
MQPVPVKKTISIIFILLLSLSLKNSFAAPSYGTRLPEKNKIDIGLQNYTILKRYQENNLGSLKSGENFLLLSYGVFDWFSIDLKGGAGNIKQHPQGSAEIDYATNFAGGYGFRLKFFDKDNMKAVFGFQHISVHPYSKISAGVKNKAILDDWQVSLLGSYSFKICTPYLGTRWSRVDYIHWTDGSRKRVMSDPDKSIGLITGIDIPVTKKIWFNAEGQFFDSSAFSLSLNYSF